VVSGSLSFASHFRLVLVRGELRGNFFNGEAERTAIVPRIVSNIAQYS
jgi:hypothetical protein